MANHKIAAQRILADRAVRSFGLPIITTATEALLGELYRTAGAVEWLGSIVSALEQQEITRGVASITMSDKRGKEIVTTASVNVWVELWQKERSHLVAVSKACHDVKIDSARVELARRQGELLGGVIDRLLGLLADRLLVEIVGRASDDQADQFRRMWDVVTSEVVPAALIDAASAATPTGS